VFFPVAVSSLILQLNSYDFVNCNSVGYNIRGDFGFSFHWALKLCMNNVGVTEVHTEVKLRIMLPLCLELLQRRQSEGHYSAVFGRTSVYPEVFGLAAWSENWK
jgi:hypothetical protein